MLMTKLIEIPPTPNTSQRRRRRFLTAPRPRGPPPARSLARASSGRDDATAADGAVLLLREMYGRRKLRGPYTASLPARGCAAGGLSVLRLATDFPFASPPAHFVVII